MKTDELIALLALDAQAPSARPAQLAYGAALAGGGALTLGLLLATLGVRPDLAWAATQPMFWVKLLTPAAICAVAGWALWRLAHPGAPTPPLARAVALLALPVWLLAALALVQALPSQRLQMVFRSVWIQCPISIFLLALPLFVLLCWALRKLAPTRLHSTGAVAGLVAGGGAAAVYALHCPELGPAYIAIWYALGMAATTAAGAWVGPRILRW
jgi:hypothetical protein